MKYSKKYRNPAMGGMYMAINSHLRGSLVGLVHQQEEICSRSTLQDRPNCLIGILKSSKLVL